MNNVLDRVLPNDSHAEQAVLGAMLLDSKESAIDAATLLKTEMFYYAAHQIIFSTIVKSIMDGVAVDTVTLMNRLNSDGKLEEIGGAAFLSDLTCNCPTAAHLEHYADIVRAKWVLRKAIESAHGLLTKAFETPDDDAVAMVTESAYEIGNITKDDKGGAVHVSEVVPKVEAQVDREYQNEGVIRGAPTGFDELDYKLQGFIDGEEIILAGHARKGKTSLAANISANFCKRGDAVFFASLEQTRDELTWRMAFAEAGIVPTEYKQPKPKQAVQDAFRRIKQWPLFVDDKRGRKAFEICAQAKRLHIRHNIRLVVVDYLQRIRWPQEGKNANMSVCIGQNAMMMADLAGELRCPVLLLSQFNRDDLKSGERPQLHHLRGSGEIEESAYKALLMSDEIDPSEDIVRGTKFAGMSKLALSRLMVVDVAKNKNGDTGAVFLTFDKPCFRFLSSSETRRTIEDDEIPTKGRYCDDRN